MTDHRGRPPWQGYALVATAAVLWAAIGVFTRELIDEGIDPIEIAFWRAVVGGALFALHRRLAGPRAPVDRPTAWRVAGFAFVGVAVFYVALPEAVDAGGIGLAAVLLYSAPVFVAVGSRVLFGERLTPARLALVGVTVLGVVLVAVSAGGEVRAPAAAVIWGLTSGAAYASYFLVGRTLIERLTPAGAYGLALPIGAVMLLPLVPFASKSAVAWLLLVGLGVVSTYLAYLAFATGLRSVDSTNASVVATLEPVVATVIGVLAYGETLVPLSIVGGLLIITAAAASATTRPTPSPVGTSSRSDGHA